MIDTLSAPLLTEALSGGAAAFRSRRRLQPAGGEGDKVFPPTFAGAVYAIEQRHVAGRDQPVTCVLLDSVQSQANRMELALQEAVDAGKIQLPLVEVDFSEYGPTGDIEADERAGRLIDAVGKVSSLQVPHRLADAILRDSGLDGVPFRKSEIGKALNTVGLPNATPLFELCPTALLFGMWDSTGPKGGLGPKFERAMVSEIVGIGAQVGDLLRGVRRDPLEVRAAVKVRKNAGGSWAVADGPGARGAVSPSEINHSSVPYPKRRDQKGDDNNYAGVTIEYAEQITTLSLICLRRLRFPLAGKTNGAADNAARVVLAALGLCAATLAFEAGVGLRSRSLLWPESPMVWELLERPGTEPRAMLYLLIPGRGTLEYLEQQFDETAIEDYAMLKVTEMQAGNKKAKRAARTRLREAYGNQLPPRKRPRLSLYHGYTRPSQATADSGAVGTVFSSHLLVFQFKARQRRYQQLDLVAALNIASRWREAILSHSDGLSEPVRRMLSGHDANGGPADDPHLAFLPLAFVGHDHADGHLLGMGLVLPAYLPRDHRREALRAIAAVHELKLGPLGIWSATPVTVSQPPWNLRPEAWTAHPNGATHWSTVTPIAFDRHPKAKNKMDQQREQLTMITKSCERIGLPRPREVIVTPVSTHIGAPPAFRFPRLKRKDGSERQHTHAILVFDEPVCGPVLIGAGRFRGYGVCSAMSGGDITEHIGSKAKEGDVSQ